MTSPIVSALQREQANALVLYLNYKKYHWLTNGPNFRDLHLLFGEHADQVLETVDELAERALMIDGTPLADPTKYLTTSSVRPSSGAEQSVRTMAEEALKAHDQVIKELHEDAETATKGGDIGTTDLFTRVVQQHQKQRWFLKEILKGKQLG